MHDTFLLNKISKSLNQICEENKIKQIDEFTIVVSPNSHITQENLQEHLQLYNKDIIGEVLQINIQREDIEKQTAIIHSIQGETFEG